MRINRSLQSALRCVAAMTVATLILSTGGWAQNSSAPQYHLIKKIVLGGEGGWDYSQLIQELAGEGMHAIKRYDPKMEKIMRMDSVTGTIENGFVHLPEKAAWLAEYLHELSTFPKGKYDDQADSTSQALHWFKDNSTRGQLGLLDY